MPPLYQVPDLYLYLYLWCPNPKTNHTRKDVAAKCRHDMRPSIKLPSVSGVDSKLA